MQCELVALRCPPQLCVESQALDHDVIHLLSVELEAVAPELLGAIHRRACVAQQRLRVLPVLRIDADAHAAGGMKFVSIELERLGHGRQQPLNDGAGIVLVPLGQDDHELIPAVAGHDIGPRRACLDASRDALEHHVAGVVAEAVVDDLEVIEVDEQDQQALIAHQFLREPQLEQISVTQPRQHVMVGQVVELLLLCHRGEREGKIACELVDERDFRLVEGVELSGIECHHGDHLVAVDNGKTTRDR